MVSLLLWWDYSDYDTNGWESCELCSDLPHTNGWKSCGGHCTVLGLCSVLLKHLYVWEGVLIHVNIADEISISVKSWELDRGRDAMRKRMPTLFFI